MLGLRRVRFNPSVVVITLLASSVLFMAPVPALAVTAPHTSISYYVGGANTTKIASIGSHDGNWAGTYCVDEYVILDFGRPARYNYTTDKGGYGTLAVSDYYGPKFLTDGGIYNLANAYVQNWLLGNQSFPCGSLVIALGTNNSYECNSTGSGHDLACDVTTAGYYWQFTEDALQRALWASNIPVEVDIADDVEGGSPGWDCYNPTVNFYTGIAHYGAKVTWLDDYGSIAYGEGGCRQGSNWTVTQLNVITKNGVNLSEDVVPECYYDNGGVASPGGWAAYAKANAPMILFASLVQIPTPAGQLTSTQAYNLLATDSGQTPFASDGIIKPPYPY